MNQKQDLKKHSDQELSLIVMNDEYFYKIRRSILRDCESSHLSILSEYFEYTEEQLLILIEDLKEDLLNK